MAPMTLFFLIMKTKLIIFSITLVSLVPVSGLAAQTPIPIIISPKVPNELNPDGGGAPNATPDQAAAFAWQEFIALNWPAGPQEGQPGQRETPSTQLNFGDPIYSGPLVWETFRGKVEIFPGNPDGMTVTPPPGYSATSGAISWGYDALPQYIYKDPILPGSGQKAESAPWINLDETDEITLCNMYAGVVNAKLFPENSAPQLVRFLAKANRVLYNYVAGNSSPTDLKKQWWFSIPSNVVTSTGTYLAATHESPPAGSTTMVSLPFGAIEVKAGWRPLNPDEVASKRFHTQKVRFYELESGSQIPVYRDETWGLVALHIIQKTPTAPYFIYATFEQADNILTADGKSVEDADGRISAAVEPATATTPQVCLVDPQPPPSMAPAMPSKSGSVILSDDPATGAPAQNPTYSSGTDSKLYYRNTNAMNPPPNIAPDGGYISVNNRDNPIPDYVINANVEAHKAIAALLKQSSVPSSPWLYYKLVNVQYYPYDKVITTVTPNGSLYKSTPPYTAKNPAPSSFYQANIMVETSRSLQLFSGGLTPAICTDWNKNGTQHQNVYYGGNAYNMGGCMGCHGSQGQNPPFLAGDFSVILARGSVSLPEPPSIPVGLGMTEILRNRTIAK